MTEDTEIKLCMLMGLIMIAGFVAVFFWAIFHKTEFPEIRNQFYETSVVQWEVSQLQILASLIVQCESNGKHNVWGKNGEYGIAQFKERTFYWLAKKAELQSPNWKDENQQLFLLNWALENGYEDYWECPKRLDN